MNVVLLTIFFGFTFAENNFGAPPEDLEPWINGEYGWYVPRSDGSFEWITKEDSIILMKNLTQDMRRGGEPTVVEYCLHTRSNPLIPKLIEPRYDSVKASYFNSKHATRFVIHGWGGSYHAELNGYIRDAWLSKGEYNIIVVDWRSRSTYYNYYNSAIYVPEIGEILAKMIDFLHVEFGMPFSSLMLIGHSLGAHIAGFAGKNVRKGRVHTIIGLDPALPLFTYENPKQRLAETDAEYVESIHTNGGILGFLKPIGRSAFYPNGGRRQPGCGLDFAFSCSHSRSYIYYVEALRTNNFPSMECPNYIMAWQRDCGEVYSSIHLASLKNAHTASGSFYVPVNTKSPFGKRA